MFGNSIWGLWWSNSIGVVSLQTFRFFPVGYRPINAQYYHHLTLNRPTTHHDGHGALYPPHYCNNCAYYNRQAYSEHSCPGNKPSPPSLQTLQSAINIMCKYLYSVMHHMTIYPRMCCRLFSLKHMQPCGNSTIYNDSTTSHLDVHSIMRM
jgi:hypothetical protein